jgi:hypothetical protein
VFLLEGLEVLYQQIPEGIPQESQRMGRESIAGLPEYNAEVRTGGFILSGLMLT